MPILNIGLYLIIKPRNKNYQFIFGMYFTVTVNHEIVREVLIQPFCNRALCLSEDGEYARHSRGFKKDDMVSFPAGWTEIWRTVSSCISHAVSHHCKLEVGI